MITLVLGGARSGKSELAERLAAAGGAVTYLATMAAPAADGDLAARIAEHRARRPPGWATVDTGPDLVGALARARGTVLVDALGPWVASLEGFAADADGLCAALVARAGDTVVVSEEVGLGVHPATDAGRRFRDALGVLNQRVAAVADQVVLVVAGRVLSLPGGPPAAPSARRPAPASPPPAAPAPASPAPASPAPGGPPAPAAPAPAAPSPPSAFLMGRHPLTPAAGALAFLTPLGRATAPTPGALLWFPAVGALVGSGVGAAWWAAARVWPPLPAAAVAVAVDLALTGMLHLDGLADTADGLLPHLDRPRRLEVMAAPEVGAFGTAVAGVTLLLRFAALAALAPAVLLAASLWCLSRTAMAVVALTQPYARAEGGLASAFLGGTPAGVVAGLGVGASLVLAWLWRPLPGTAALAAAAFGAAAVAVLARRRLGGFTGDVLGAAGVVAETVGLLVAAARW